MASKIYQLYGRRALSLSSAAGAGLVVDLVIAEGDHVGADRRQYGEDVPLVAQHGLIHGLQRGDHAVAIFLPDDRLVLEQARG